MATGITKGQNDKDDDDDDDDDDDPHLQWPTP